MGQKVLVVDDEKLIVKGIRFSLEQDGMEVDYAYDGESALEAAHAKQYDVILLDVIGKQISSPELAEKIDSLTLSGTSHITFVIGGAFGYTDALRKRADFALSFSKMTFTHQMIRLLLIEQIYRAFKISRGEKYHN